MIDEKIAIEVLEVNVEKKPSEIAEAIDVLYEKFGTYQEIAKQVNCSDRFLSTRHRIFKTSNRYTVENRPRANFY